MPHSPQQQDVLIRMQEDLKRALAKQPQDRRWVMVIDLRKCVGCHACTMQHRLPHPGRVPG